MSTDDRINKKFNNIGFVFLMTVKTSRLKSFNELNREFTQYHRSDLTENEKEKIILEFACEDRQVGISLIKIILMLKKFNLR